VTTSEGEFAADLDDASRGGIGDLPGRGIAHAVINGGSAARSTADQSAGTDCILVVVPRVEEVARNPEIHVLGNREALHDAHIPIVDAGLAQRVAGKVAICAQCWLREAVRVDPLHHFGQVGVNVAPGNLVRTLKLAV